MDAFDRFSAKWKGYCLGAVLEVESEAVAMILADRFDAFVAVLVLVACGWVFGMIRLDTS